MNNKSYSGNTLLEGVCICLDTFITMTWHMSWILRRVYVCLWHLSLSVFRSIMTFWMQIWHCLRCLWHL